MNLFTYQAQRELIKLKLKGTGRVVYNVLKEFPELRSVKRRNDLVRKVWEVYEDVSCESITRCARKIQARGTFDTEDNLNERSNIEVAYRSHFAS